MKKLVLSIALLLILVTVTACFSSESTTASSSQVGEGTTVGVVTTSTADTAFGAFSSDTPAVSTTAPPSSDSTWLLPASGRPTVPTTVPTTAPTIPSETTYPDIVYDTTPIEGKEGEPYQIHFNPYLLSPLISDTQTPAFHKAITAILNHRKTVTYESREIAALVKDNLFYEFPLSALCDITAEGTTLTFTYRYARDTHLQKIRAFGKEVETIIATYLLFGDDEAEKAIMLYHAVSYTVDYFHVNYQPWQTNAYNAIIDKRSICYGFADAYNYLLRQVGVEAWLVKGYRPSDRAAHGWSLIRVGNSYYHCDPTWEYNNCNGVGFYYFAMNDQKRASAIALSEATVGEGDLKRRYDFTANGIQFDKMSGDKYRSLTWEIDRDKRVLRIKGKEYPYDNP